MVNNREVYMTAYANEIPATIYQKHTTGMKE